MPTRHLHEKICYSNDLDKLSAFEETIFYRLIVNVDDFGRIDARPGFLKSKLFVTKNGVSEKNVSETVARMASLGLVRLYEVDGKPFLCLPKWHLYQKVRNSKEIYPPPPENDDSKSLEEHAKLFQPEVFCIMPCNGKKQEFQVTRQYIAEMSELYPGVDVERETLEAKAWLVNNPSRCKTHNGMTRYLGGWYSRAQNNAGSRAIPQVRAPATKQRPLTWAQRKLAEIAAEEEAENARKQTGN